jgi:hypothetical protein
MISSLSVKDGRPDDGRDQYSPSHVQFGARYLHSLPVHAPSLGGGKEGLCPVVGQIYPTIGKPRNDFIAFASTAQASPSSVVCLREQPEQPFALRYNGVDGRHFEISVPSRSTELNELKYSTHSNDTFVIRRFCDSKCSLFREITNLLDSRAKLFNATRLPFLLINKASI